MKTGLLSIALLLVLQHFTAAQAYRPLLREGSQWELRGGQAHPLCTRISLSRIFFGGDTLINQMTYKKLLWQGSESVAPYPPAQSLGCAPHVILPEIRTNLAAFLREDSVNRKVWIWHRDLSIPNSSFEESLLFDFSLDEGDTLKSDYHMDNDSVFLVVDSIRYELYPWDPTQMTKTYYMTPATGPSSLILDPRIFEGFGSAVFIGRMGFQIGFGFSPPNVSCYIHSPTSPVSHLCTRYLSTEEVNSPELNIYPNPALDFITIDGLTIADRATVRLCDIQGKILLSSPLNEDFKVDISALQQGLYFLLVETNGKLITSKILKQ
jgi:hypothetical protein